MKKIALCDMSKQYIQKNIDQILEIIVDPAFICYKCARTANDQSYLCKPMKIKKLRV